MRKYLKISCLLILPILSVISCKRNSIENYQSSIDNLLQPISKTAKGQDVYDVKDMRGCGTPIEKSVWYLSGGYKKSLSRDVYIRDVSSIDGSIISSGGNTIDFNLEDHSNNLVKNPDYHIVYIGPWKEALLIDDYPFLFGFLNNFKTQDEFNKLLLEKGYAHKKEIRFVAYTGRGGGHIFRHFESKTPKNIIIKERAFSLPKMNHGYPPKEHVCITKWIANFGYDAISEVKSNNLFSRNYKVPTGKIINAYSGEVIADFSKK
jgi:hypothetical protein